MWALQRDACRTPSFAPDPPTRRPACIASKYAVVNSPATTSPRDVITLTPRPHPGPTPPSPTFRYGLPMYASSVGWIDTRPMPLTATSVSCPNESEGSHARANTATAVPTTSLISLVSQQLRPIDQQRQRGA